MQDCMNQQNLTELVQKEQFFQFESIPSIFELRKFQFQDKLKTVASLISTQKQQHKPQFIVKISDNQIKFYLSKNISPSQNQAETQKKLEAPKSEKNFEQIGQSLITLDFLKQVIKKKKSQLNQENSIKQSQNLYKIFAQAISKAQNQNDQNSPDMFVNDIYGPNCSAINLPGDLLASSLGKLGACQGKITQFSIYSIVRSLLTSLAVNIGHLTGIYLFLYKQVTDLTILLTNLGGLSRQSIMVIVIAIKAYSPNLKVRFNLTK